MIQDPSPLADPSAVNGTGWAFGRIVSGHHSLPPPSIPRLTALSDHKTSLWNKKLNGHFLNSLSEQLSLLRVQCSQCEREWQTHYLHQVWQCPHSLERQDPCALHEASTVAASVLVDLRGLLQRHLLLLRRIL
jgi:hypothetical protein